MKKKNQTTKTDSLQGHIDSEYKFYTFDKIQFFFLIVVSEEAANEA